MKQIIDALEAARDDFANLRVSKETLAKIDAALAAAREQQPDCCVHGVRYPHECKECLNAARGSEHEDHPSRR